MLLTGCQERDRIKSRPSQPLHGSDFVSETLSGLHTTKIDILVNNAALIDVDASKPLSQITLQQFLRVMQENVYAPASTTNAVI